MIESLQYEQKIYHKNKEYFEWNWTQLHTIVSQYSD